MGVQILNNQELIEGKYECVNCYMNLRDIRYQKANDKYQLTARLCYFVNGNSLSFFEKRIMIIVDKNQLDSNWAGLLYAYVKSELHTDAIDVL